MTATDWNLADVLEVCAEVRAAANPALVSGSVRLSWAELDRRAAGVAAALLDAGLGHQAKVTQYLYNCNEYLESSFAAMKAGMVPVNTNYRYEDEELCHLWDDADVEAVVFHGSFADRLDRLRRHPRLKGLRLFLHVDDGSGPCPGFARSYEEAASSLAAGADTAVKGPWGRSGDDLYLLYTGGTTGVPKGVMWRQDDLFSILNDRAVYRMPEDGGLEGLRQGVENLGEAAPVLLPACPLMHGTGAFTAWSCLMVGGCVVTVPGRSFDPVAVLEAVGRQRVRLLALVGDSFARPLLGALEAEPGRFDLSSLLGIISSGVIWSEETKRGLLRHAPQVMLVDAFSSSEALGMGSSVSTAGGEVPTARFLVGDKARVIDDDGNDVEPGSGLPGRLAVAGRLPLGYYKDPTKTAATFKIIGGRRHSVPGDLATVDADGTLCLLGRGAACINSGGEKIFPEEVDEVLKTHPAVVDAACVGVPDERFGEAICALVELRSPGAVSAGDLVAHVRTRLAAFKAPRNVVEVDSLERGPAGKLDYELLRSRAEAAVRGGSPPNAALDR